MDFFFGGNMKQELDLTHDVFMELKVIKEDKIQLNGDDTKLSKQFDNKFQQFKKNVDYIFSDGKKTTILFTTHAKEQFMNRVSDKFNPVTFSDFVKKILEGMYSQFETINKYFYDGYDKFMVFSKSYRLGMIVKFGRVRSMNYPFSIIVITVLPFYKTNGNIDTIKVFTESINDSMKFISVD